MRPDAERLARGAPNPVPSASSTSSVLVAVLLLLALVGLLVAVSYPTASLAVGAAALVVRYGVRPLAGRLRRVARERGMRPVCVPRTDVCLEA